MNHGKTPRHRGVAPYEDVYGSVGPLGASSSEPAPPPLPPRHKPPNPVTVPSLAEVAPEAVEWLWSGRLPFGKLAVLDGNPGTGKSTLTMDLAARLTTGRPMPGSTDSSEPYDVLILNLEDGPGDTIRPRAEAAGADLSRIRVINKAPVSSDGATRFVPFQIPRDLSYLKGLIQEHGVRLVVIDVLNQFVGRKADTYKDQDMRATLGPLADLATMTGTCVLALRHLTKSHRDQGYAMFAGSGSIAIVGLARAGLIAAEHPREHGKFVLAVSKNNLSRPAPSLTYELVDVSRHGCARVEWGEHLDVTADQLLIPAGHDKGGQARMLVERTLADGPVPSVELRETVEGEGISPRTLKRARKELGVKAERRGYGSDGRWEVVLPDSVQ
jgi:hypothetical protein